MFIMYIKSFIISFWSHETCYEATQHCLKLFLHAASTKNHYHYVSMCYLPVCCYARIYYSPVCCYKIFTSNIRFVSEARTSLLYFGYNVHHLFVICLLEVRKFRSENMVNCMSKWCMFVYKKSVWYVVLL
jgi:hypothetical protein